MSIDDFDEIESVDVSDLLAALDQLQEDQDQYDGGQNTVHDRKKPQTEAEANCWQQIVTEFVRQDVWATGSKTCSAHAKGYDETGRVNLPIIPWSWQDFLPSYRLNYFSVCCWSLPSLIEYIPELSDTHTQTEGALWFNFVFDWWFTEPLHPVDEPEPADESTYPHPCSNCSRRFQQEWELSRHYIDNHLVISAKSPSPELPSPHLEPSSPYISRESTPESEEDDFDYEDDLLLLKETFCWRWEDFLPDWDEDYLPTPRIFFFNTLDIFDPDYQKPREPTPSPPFVRKEFVLRIPAPVLKQTKYFCKTCSLTICNLCFTKKCAAHNVDWMGQGKFACGAC